MSSTVWSVLIAGLALLVSAISFILNHKTNSKQTELQERLLAIEEGREIAKNREAQSAQVCARIERDGSNRNLILENRGAALARELRIFVDGQPLLEHDLVPSGQTEIKELWPHAEACYKIAIAMGAPSAVEVAIVWNDQSGIDRTWRSSISVL